jgi:hypothetical protein
MHACMPTRCPRRHQRPHVNLRRSTASAAACAAPSPAASTSPRASPASPGRQRSGAPYAAHTTETRARQKTGTDTESDSDSDSVCTCPPVRDDAARSRDDGHKRHVVVRLQVRLRHQVAEAHGEQAVRVAVAAVHGHAHRGRQVVIGGARCGVEHERGCAVQVGVGECAARAHAHARAVQRRARAGHAQPALAQHRLVDDAQEGLA